MRYLCALCFIFSIFLATRLCSARDHASYHGVQASYEADPLTSASALKPLIILDPGHGGSDEGAKVGGSIEKKLSLTTAHLTKKHLEELGYRVIMTRSRDTYLRLQRRVLIANKTKGALFVSIHFNSAPNEEAQGVEVYFHNSNEKWRTRASQRLANCILYRVIDQTDAISRGTKQRDFHVIRETEMPAVLVEGGFITNREERGKLRDRAYLDRLAIGIAQGIDKYMKM